MRNLRKVLPWFFVSVVFGIALIAYAATFTETFSTINFKDAATTSAEWDTILGQVNLTNSETFSQPAGLINWGGQIRAIHYNGTDTWLVGGEGAKLNSYNGSIWTSLAASLSGFNNSTINSIWHESGTWLVAGAGKKLNSYNGLVFIDESSNMQNWTNENINAVRYGGGFENFWLVAGAGGKINRYNGSSFTDLSGTTGYFPNTVTAYSIGFSSGDDCWLIGGSFAQLSKYDAGNFVDLSFKLQADIPTFGTTTIIYSIAYDGTNFYLGCSGGKLVRYNVVTNIFTDLSANVTAFVNILSMDYNGTYLMLGGNGTSLAPIIYTYDGTWRNQSVNLDSFGSDNPIYAIASGNSRWFIGGDQVHLNERTGTASETTYTDRSGLLRDMAIIPINAIGADSSQSIILGGDSATLNTYDGAAFTDISNQLASVGWGNANVRAVTGNGTYWLIGGSNNKLVRYDGIATTDLTSALGFTGSILSIHWNGSYWLIGGTDRQLSRYNGSTFTPLDISSYFGALDDVKAMNSGGGVWYIGGDAGTLITYNGSTFAALTSGFTDINAIAYAPVGSFHRFIIGGVTSPQRIRVHDTLGFWLTWETLVNFSSNAVLSIDYSATDALFLIGGANAKINTYDWEGCVDVSNDTVDFGASDVSTIAYNVDYWLLGGGEARLNKFGPVYDFAGVAQSDTIVTSFQNFYSVTLTATDTIPVNTTIDYYMTANGQLADPHAFWIQVTPGVATIFNGGMEGQRLKWKAELATTDENTSPKVFQIDIQYQVPSTYTPTATITSTFTSTATSTPTFTATRTPTPTSTVSATSTTSPTISPTPTVVIVSPTSTITPSHTSTFTFTPTETVTSTITSTTTLSPTITDTPTITETPTETPVVSSTPSATVTITQTWTASPTPTANPDFTFYNGALIIPMDNTGGRTNQDYGMWRAYGLVYELLKNGIPVHWAIRSYKNYDEIDFTCSQTKDIRTDAPYTTPSYAGGPFIIANTNSTAASAIITTWNTGQTNIVNVHQYTDSGSPFTAPIYRKLRAAPRIALFANSDNRNTWRGARTYLNNAAIPDSDNQSWPSNSSSSPDVLTESQIAGTQGSQQDGALFDGAGGAPVFSMVVNMHWAAYPIGRPTSSNSTRNYGADWSIRQYEGLAPSSGPGTSSGGYTGSWNTGAEVYQNVTARADSQEAVAELDRFMQFGSAHVYAQCIGVAALENNIVESTPNWNDFVYGGNGHWLTTGGITDTYNEPANRTPVDENADKPAMQATGSWDYVSGSQSAFGLQAGSAFYGGTSAIFYQDTASVTYPFLFMNGYYKGLTSSGKASYLVGHSSSNQLPYSGNSQGPMMRFFYNSIFESPGASEAVPEMYLTMTAPGDNEIGNQHTYTINYLNLSGVANNVIVTNPYPANAIYFNSTGGGVPGGGVVTWNLGTLAEGASGNFTVTYVLLDSSGAGWDNQAYVDYNAGITQFVDYTSIVHTNEVVFTPTPTVTLTATVTPTPTASVTLTSSPTSSPTITVTSTYSPTVTYSPTATFSPTITFTPTITYSPTITATATHSPTITSTFTHSPTATITPVLSPTPTSTVSATHTISVTYTPSLTSTPSSTYTATPTATLTEPATVSPTWTGTPIYTATSSFTPVVTLTATETITVTSTPTVTVTVTTLPTTGEVLVYPNPFNASKAHGKVLKIINLPQQSDVTIFTISGEKVIKFEKVSGRQTWDGTNGDGTPVVTGVYIYLIRFNDGSNQTGKLFVVK